MRSRMLFLVISLTLFTFCSCTRKLPPVESGEALVRANSTAAPLLGVHRTLPDEYHDQAPSLGVHRTLPDAYHGQMESNNPQHGHIMEVSRNVLVGESSAVVRKVCGGGACGFSDAGINSKDAKERSASMRKLSIVVVLCVIFMCVEVLGGIKANSLAILTDAAHLLTDVASFAISLFSLWSAGWAATPHRSYGFFRIEILGALVSIQLIWLLTGVLVYEGTVRMIHGTGEVQGLLMFMVAAFGLVVNIAMAVLLGHDHGHVHDHDHEGNEITITRHQHHDHEGNEITITRHQHGDHFKHTDRQKDHDHVHEPLLKEDKKRNINVQSAYLHVLGDLIQSVGVMIGGAIIWYKPEWKIVDLICTLIFSVVVLATTIKMLRSILNVLMESTPKEIDVSLLEKGLCEMDEVLAVHELHIWEITVGKVLLACHVKIKPDADADTMLEKVVDYIRMVYNITHVTIQIER